MVLLSETKIYIEAQIIPVASALVSAGLMVRMYLKLIKLQQEEEISSAKITAIVKKYVGLMVLVNILASVIYLIDSYF